MRAILLAAGRGTRLRPLTDQCPKCLVPIRGVPLLTIWLEQCRRAGITEVVVNLHSHPDAVRAALSLRANGPKVRFSEEPVLLGSGGTLRHHRQWLAVEQEFFVLYADVLTNLDLRKILAFHRFRRPATTLGLCQVKDPSRCGVVTFDGDQVVREFVEKPAHPKSNWAFSGVLIGTPDLLAAIPPQSPADLGHDVLPKMVHRMLAYPISDYLLDIGTMENYQAAQTTWPGLAEGDC